MIILLNILIILPFLFLDLFVISKRLHHFFLHVKAMKRVEKLDPALYHVLRSHILDQRVKDGSHKLCLKPLIVGFTLSGLEILLQPNFIACNFPKLKSVLPDGFRSFVGLYPPFDSSERFFEEFDSMVEDGGFPHVHFDIFFTPYSL